VHDCSSDVSYFDYRDRLLGPQRFHPLTTPELCQTGRIVYGTPERFSLYGIPAPRMEAAGLRVLGRTAIECVIDAYAIQVAAAIAQLCDTQDPAAVIIDLFCGSGNFGFQLQRGLRRTAYASELDVNVYSATRNNFDRVAAQIDLQLSDYRALLYQVPGRRPDDIYIVEPPWGPALTEDGLDVDDTSPPVPEIIDDICRSRQGRSCLIVIKTNDRIANNSLARSFSCAAHLRTIAPVATLPYGVNTQFHIYRTCAELRRVN
jgi:hypothetical protein